MISLDWLEIRWSRDEISSEKNVMEDIRKREREARAKDVIWDGKADLEYGKKK